MNPTHLIYLLFLIELILSGFLYILYIGSAVTAIFLLIAGVVGCRAVFARHAWQTYALSKLMLVYLAWLFIVALSSAVPQTSMMTLATLAGLPVMYLVASNTPTFAEIWRHLRSFLFVMGVGLAAWAIWQVTYHVGDGQAVGPLGDRNVFAALMNLLWFPVAYLFLTGKSTSYRWMLLLGGGLFVMSTALFATASRGGIATWLLLLPILLWAGYHNTQSRRLVAIIPLIALLAYLCSALLLHTSVADRTFQLAQDPSTNARLLLWQSSIQMTLAHPFTGTGWGSFVSYYPAYRSPLENDSAGFFAHNDYLQLAAEGGIAALLLQLGMLLGVLFQLKRSLKHAADAASLESTALLLGVLALFIHAWVNFIFYFEFMTILAGLYLARAAQLTDTPHIIMIPSFGQISLPVKRLLAGFIVLLIAAPFGLNLIAQSLNSQSNIKLTNLLTPNVTAYKIAKLITAICPQERIAQEVVLQTAELALADSAFISRVGGDFQRELLKETLQRFDAVRAQTANSPSVGVRQAKILMAHHATLGDDIAYTKAHQVLSDNLQADPYHINSIIMLARLQAAEGHRAAALYTLQRAKPRILKRRDQQFIAVEILRQLAAPKVILELDDIEKQLRLYRSAAEAGKSLTLPARFNEDIDARLKVIAGQIQQAYLP